MKSVLKLAIFAACVIGAVGCGKEPVGDQTPVAPGVPQGVVLTANTGTSLTFSWKAVEGAEKYAARLEYSDGKFLAQKNPVGTSVTFDDLLKASHTSSRCVLWQVV